MPSNQASNILSIINQSAIGGSGGDDSASSSSSGSEPTSGIDPNTGGIGYSPGVGTINVGGDGLIKLPSNFAFSFQNQNIVTDSAGVQTVNVDVVIPAITNADDFELRVVLNG